MIFSISVLKLNTYVYFSVVQVKIISLLFVISTIIFLTFSCDRNAFSFSIITDCSYKIANIINHLNYGNSIDNLINDKEETAVKVKRLRKDW